MRSVYAILFFVLAQPGSASSGISGGKEKTAESVKDHSRGPPVITNFGASEL